MTSQEPSIADYYRARSRMTVAERNQKWMFGHEKAQLEDARMSFKRAQNDLQYEYERLHLEHEIAQRGFYENIWAYLDKTDFSDGLTRSDFSDATTNATSKAHPAPEDGTEGTA